MMDLGNRGLTFDLNVVKGRELEMFIEKYKMLTRDELKISLQVTRAQFQSVLSVTVPCVGCRRSVDRLFDQLMDTVYPTVYPIVITSNGMITISQDKIRSPSNVCGLLYQSDDLLNELVELQPRNKKSSRCGLHSLDSFRSRPFSEVWPDVWDCMNERCRREIAVVEAEELHATLDGYLKKHKFCSDCRTKVEKAYNLLVNESNPSKEAGYVAALYAGITKKCIANKHIHLLTDLDYIDTLIRKAEPELNGSHFRNRERHAKTLEIAQEEVLTCIGMCIYEKLRRIHVCLREEENACQLLGAVAVSALARNFGMAVEKKSGISKLELLYEELSREEKLKEQRKEQKKLKKRRKRNEKKNNSSQRTCDACDDECIADICSHDEESEDAAGPEEEVTENTEHCSDDVEKDNISIASCHCHDANNGDVVCTQTSIDGGYSSEQGHEGSCSRTAASSLQNTPEGSEVACSDGLCNHDDSGAARRSSRSSPEFCSRLNSSSSSGFTCLLEKMLDDSQPSEEDDEPGIPDEYILEYKSRLVNVKKAREELRERLIHNFNRLCIKSTAQKN